MTPSAARVPRRFDSPERRYPSGNCSASNCCLRCRGPCCICDTPHSVPARTARLVCALRSCLHPSPGEFRPKGSKKNVDADFWWVRSSWAGIAILLFCISSRPLSSSLELHLAIARSELSADRLGRLYLAHSLSHSLSSLISLSRLLTVSFLATLFRSINLIVFMYHQ